MGIVQKMPSDREVRTVRICIVRDLLPTSTRSLANVAAMAFGGLTTTG